MTMTYQETIKAEPRLEGDEAVFENGLLLCTNCGTPASASLSVAVGWIGCAPCITGEARSFNDEDLILEEEKANV
jgi:hypothetical protein